MHTHQSLWKDGKPLFAGDGYAGLSQMALWYTGGLLKHARALSPICAPTVNSYKRLVVGRSLTGATWAPAYICYGGNNRSGMIRSPGGRLELRLPDAPCNPYLATAAVIAAGMDGVINELDPGTPQNDNLYEYSQSQLDAAGIKVLPQNLLEARLALEKAEVIRAALGPVVDEFMRLKHMEWVEYMRHVSDWEVNRRSRARALGSS